MCRSSGKLDAIETKDSKPEETGNDFLFLDTVTAAVDETKTQRIEIVKTLFARHGVPEVVKSDTGPQYSAEFAKTWGFKHVTSSPLYPQSNGLVERTVRTAKSIVAKARRDYQDPNLAILEHRNTPINGVGSLSRLSIGRRLWSTRGKIWKPAIITSKAETPRSFNIMTEDGAQYRRNRIHLRKAYDRVSRSSSPEKSTEGPSKSRLTHRSGMNNYNIKKQENKETLSSTGETASPVKTRLGRMIRKPTQYKDYV
ncbi:sec1 family domain-containing 2 [Paramuricea clavata]|uniref:Sec1 family domain-containing 2 n=1 Tax=Paramuricea clavata TaxID=317549 RepID=A0A6S7IYB1_PARCT|nr:sec1 family domain-containing 2 [Paramuricea clavata]